jgi:hypothetical protein
MSNTPHMLPCPFCNGDARHDAHSDDCYFILHRKLKGSGADMSSALEVLKAWNRRAPQPVVREPLTEEHLEAAVEAWFSNSKYSSFQERMRLAIEAAHGITQKGGTP